MADDFDYIDRAPALSNDTETFIDLLAAVNKMDPRLQLDVNHLNACLYNVLRAKRAQFGQEYREEWAGVWGRSWHLDCLRMAVEHKGFGH